MTLPTSLLESCRWLAGFVTGSSRETDAASAWAASSNIPESRPPRLPPLDETDERTVLVRRFLQQGRTAVLLRPQIAQSLSTEHRAYVVENLHRVMSYVAGGTVAIAEWNLEMPHVGPGEGRWPIDEVPGCYLDRHPVTCRQFGEFVADGGYRQRNLWDEAIWPRVSEFVDRTGCPGPRFWRQGAFPAEARETPVVGVNWYEADAYARWAGCRLPTDGEWLKAASCPAQQEGGELVQRRYPWGDEPDTRRVNLWAAGVGQPAPVSSFPGGTSPEGLAQLIGNVWEWTASDVRITSYGREVTLDVPLKSLRGGAFDLYFENQATCQLHSGDSPLARRHNVGFRCVLPASDVIDPGAPS